MSKLGVLHRAAPRVEGGVVAGLFVPLAVVVVAHHVHVVLKKISVICHISSTFFSLQLVLYQTGAVDTVILGETTDYNQERRYMLAF